MILCPACGRHLTPETNDELCLGSLYKHGKHPIFVFDCPRDAYEFRSEVLPTTCPESTKTLENVEISNEIVN